MTLRKQVLGSLIGLLFAVSFTAGLWWLTTPSNGGSSAPDMHERIRASLKAHPWPSSSPSKKDVYLVKEVQEVEKTGIKLVTVERQGDGWLMTAFSGRDHKIGSQVELIEVSRIQGSTQERKTSLMVK